MKKLVMFSILVLLAATFAPTAKAVCVNPAEWHFYLETYEEDVSWSSDTNVPKDFPRYDWTEEVTQMDVLISGLGWISLISELPPDMLFASGTEDGLPFGSCERVEEPGVFAADICEGVNASGYGYGSITNISFGQVEVEGSYYALEGLRIGGNATVHAVPEPATVLLLGLGSLVLLRRRRT